MSTAAPARPPYPRGGRVVLDRRSRVTRTGDGRVRVLGGEPMTLVTLTPDAAARIRDGVVEVRDATSAALARALTDRGLAHPVPTGGPPRALDDVTVVVPVHEDAAGAAELVRSLRPELGRGLRVVLVDDASRVPLTVTGPGVQVLRHDRCRGPAAARDTGTAAAVTGGAEVVVYLDADVRPCPGWLDPVLAHLDDPAVWAVAPRVVAARPGRCWVRGFETARSALDLGPDPARVRPRTRVPYVPSAALAVRLAVLPPAPGGGPFDERLRVAEDVDLCWRLDAAGGLVRYEPSSRVAHRHREDALRMLRRRSFYGTGAAPLAARHGAAVAPAVFSPWSLLFALGVWSASPPGLLVTAGAYAWAVRRTAGPVGGTRTAARVVARGAAGAVRQLPSALLRPYWPLTAVVLLASAPARGRTGRELRRRLAAAAVVEGLWHWWDCREPGHLPVDEPLGHLLLHRLDDLAYGFGVWRSAVAARSAAALRPELRR